MPRRTPRILLIEDNEDLAFGLQINLEGEGFRVLVAHTLQAANMALQHTPDLIVLDLMLPDGNGFDFLRTFSRAR
ncbi:MAG: response regulator [Longimicrobiales bacterium]